MNVYILAAGDYPRRVYPRLLLTAADYPVVCCDGALHDALKHGLNVAAVVGDMDSVPKADLKRFGGEVVRVAEQDDNDLTKALHYVLGRWPDVDNITIFGATGRREAHTVANLSIRASSSSAKAALCRCSPATPLCGSARKVLSGRSTMSSSIIGGRRPSTAPPPTLSN